MEPQPRAAGRRERAKQDKQRRILAAATDLLAERDVGRVAMQEVADRAGVPIGTLYLYAGTKAELLIMVQNQKFATAIDDGLAAATAAEQAGAGAVETIMTLLHPVLARIREHPENGRAYLNALVFGYPMEPCRAEGLTAASRLEDGIAHILGGDPAIDRQLAPALARVVTAIIHVTITQTPQVLDSMSEVLRRIRRQVDAVVRFAASHDEPNAQQP